MNPDFQNNALKPTRLFSESLLAKYKKVRDQSLALCQPLATEDFVVQPAPFVSPPKWHLAHTTWFFEQMILKPYLSCYTEFSSNFTHIFNSYYKSLGPHWQQGERGFLSRPTVDQIIEYRSFIDSHMQKCLLQSRPKNKNEFLRLVELGLQHEMQHQELLLMDIKYILAFQPTASSYSSHLSDEFNANDNQIHGPWKSFQEGLYDIGFSGDNFSFDNENPQHKVYVYPYEISESYVTNEEYLGFIDQGGYHQPKLWKSEGWDWLNQQSIKAPLYWQETAQGWQEQTLYGLTPLVNHWPVCHLSFFEADAFARWKGCRLPTEQESEIYLMQSKFDQNDEQTYFHATDAWQSQGQLWWWTQSQYVPYPRYKPYVGALNEYNGKFMCNQFVLKGGCVATPHNHHRSSYRNFYKPEQRWMFSGLRLVKDII